MYVTENGKITVTNPTAVSLPNIPNENTIVDNSSLPTSHDISITGKKSMGYYASSAGEITNIGNSSKVTNGSSLAYSTGANSNINLSNSLLDYSGEGYALYTKNSGKINATGSVLILRNKAVGMRLSSTNDITFNNGKIVMMSNDAIPFEVSNAGTINVSNIRSGLGIPSSVLVVKGKDGTTIFNKYKTLLLTEFHHLT